MNSEALRRVHNTEIFDKNFHQDSPSEVTKKFDYNTCVSATMFLASMTNRNSDTYLPSEYYNSLTPEAKEIWRKLTSDMKSMILKGRNNKPINKCDSNKNKPAKPSPYKGKPFTKAKLHELLSEFLEENKDSEKDDDVIEGIDEVNYPDHTLLVNVTSTNSINHSGIRKLLSTPEKGKPSSSTTKKSAFKSEIMVNGKACCQFEAHITYCVSKTSRSSQH